MRQIIEGQQAGGLTIKEYCKRNYLRLKSSVKGRLNKNAEQQKTPPSTGFVFVQKDNQSNWAVGRWRQIGKAVIGLIIKMGCYRCTLCDYPIFTCSCLCMLVLGIKLMNVFDTRKQHIIQYL